jgi:CRP/FNR family transcriptional regulator
VVLSELVAQELAEERDQADLDKRAQVPNERRKAERRQAERAGPDGMPGRRLAARRSEESQPGDVLITATQTDLAQLAGSSRESASRFLAVLERAGVISQGRGRLVVHDPEALKQYVF